MGVISGLSAAVEKDGSAESTLSGWQVRDIHEIAPASYAGSNTRAGMTSTQGNQDWRGRYQNYGHTPLLFPGDQFTFLGSINALTGCSGAAICDRIIITAAGEEGRNILCVSEFSSNGALSYGAAVASDVSTPTIYNAAGRKVARGGVDVDETSYWRLILGARNRRFFASGVPGVARRQPGVFYAQWMYQCYTDDPTSIPARGSVAALRFYVTAALYWELSLCRFDLIDEFGADIEGQKPVGYTAAGSFVGYIGGSPIGHVINPAGTTKWP